MARSVNLAFILGNLTRDPQMRYTPNGTAVASFSVATNRTWLSEGIEQEAVDFHNIVVWNKLAETCNNLLSKGRKVFVRGRIANRTWDDAAGLKHYRTEIVAEEVIFLDAPRGKAENESKQKETQAKETEENESVNVKEENISAEDIPF